MLKKCSIILFNLVILYSFIVSPVFALEEKTQANETKRVESKPLSKGKLLPKEAVLVIANKHINGYLQNDLQTKGRVLNASTDFIPLYDLNNHVFAYIVPLLERNKEIGYITVGAIEDGYDAYEIFIGVNAATNIKNKLDSEERQATSDTKLIFVPPMIYMTQVSDGKNKLYFEISNSSQFDLDRTSAVEANRETLQSQYDKIRSKDNEQHINQLTESEERTSFAANVTPENVSLGVEANFGMFVPVYNGSNYAYGGDQNWYKDSDWRNRGCGPVAAANITNYLAKIKSPATYGALYTGDTSSHTDFLSHMNKLYNYVNPGPLGKLSVSGFASAVEKYAKDKKVPLVRVTSNASFTLDNTAAYIKNGLSINSPVATLNLSKWSGYDYEWHWMTITKYFRDAEDNRWIAVSTWGERRSINYRTHFEAIKSFRSLGGGFMYFK